MPGNTGTKPADLAASDISEHVQSDGVHPDQTGQEKIAEIVYGCLQHERCRETSAERGEKNRKRDKHKRLSHFQHRTFTEDCYPIEHKNTFQEGAVLIEVRNLVKKYGDHLAVDHLDFKLESGKSMVFWDRTGRENPPQ